MGADMGAVPVLLMRKENDTRLMRGQNIGDDGDTLCPVLPAISPSARINGFQAVRSRRQQAKANVLAGVLQLAKSFGLALLFAAMGHCDVEDFHPRLAHETQGEPADDAFI